MAEISVIIPVYKVEATLKKCVDSVLGQTFGDYEIILVDDGSPDACPRICDEYEREDDRVTVIHKKNGGLSDARNAGLKKACGNYVMFLDSDDYLAENCLELLHEHDADMIIGSIAVFREDGRMTYQKERNSEMFTREDLAGIVPELFRENRLNYIHAKLYRRSVIEAHDLSFEDSMLTSAEDTVFNFSFLPYCERIYVSGETVHFYRYSYDGLGKKFYPDRYRRFLRLESCVADSVRRMGIESGAMEKELRRRRALSAIFSMDGILAQTGLDRREKAGLLDEIASDQALKKILEDGDIYRSDELEYLLKRGGYRLVLRDYRISLRNRLHHNAAKKKQR